MAPSRSNSKPPQASSGECGGLEPQGRWGSAQRTILFACLAILATYLSLTVYAGSVITKADPATALKLAPFNSSAQANWIDDRILAGGTGSELRAVAERAVRRDPLNTAAWRVLGLIEASSGNPELALRIVSFANFLSRRDGVANLWLIERYLQQNDLDNALKHYDYALRSSLRTREQLLPRLVEATAEAQTIRPIADVLLASPDWAQDFFAAMNNLAPSGDNAAELIKILKTEGFSGSFALPRYLPQRFAGMNDVEAAGKIYRLLGGGIPSSGRLDFVQEDPMQPFDWELTNDQPLEAIALHDRGDAAQSILAINAEPDQVKSAAKRMLELKPGGYALGTASVAVEGVAPEYVAWRVTCNDGGAVLAEVRLAAPSRSRQTMTFDVPANCPAQWLNLIVATRSNPGAAQLEITSPVLRPLSR